MEDNHSLLAEALQANKQVSTLQNTLLIDVYLLDDDNKPRTTILLQLADLANQLNAYFHNLNYPWNAGGDGVVFGIHISDDDIAHLRGHCIYGTSVTDEWFAIQQMVAFPYNVAVRCWDVDDGHVLLIQTAEHLPPWVDNLGPEQCDYRCWIYQNCLHLIEHQAGPVDLPTALECLRNRTSQSFPSLLRQILSIYTEHKRHRAAVCLPRPVAGLLERRPDLVPILAQHFYKSSTNELQMANNPFDAVKDVPTDDWVWTILHFPRPVYAMMRTLETTQWNENTMIVESPEIKKIKQKFQNDSTPHLQMGLQLGIRLLFGLNECLSTTRCDRPSRSSMDDHVLVHWARMAQKLQLDDWLCDNYRAGPNHAIVDLSNIVNCPVFETEIVNRPTSYSFPETSLSAQFRSELLKTNVRDDRIPRPDQVDSEDWMTLEGDADLARISVGGTAPEQQQSHVLDEMMEGVQTFIKGTSSARGVETARNVHKPLYIDPALFLRTLHAALKAETAQDLKTVLLCAESDPFFSKEDYDLMEPDNSDDDDINMNDLMQAMDDELQQSSKLSRALDGVDDQVSESAHVLSNLLQSLASSEGGPGPVRNLLGEMGRAPPNVTSSETDS